MLSKCLRNARDICLFLDLHLRTEIAVQGLIVYDADNTVMQFGQVARDCKELSVAECAEVGFGRLQHDWF